MQQGRLNSRLAPTDRMGARERAALDGVPRELLEEPLIRRLNLDKEPAGERLFRRLVTGFECDPAGPHADVRLDCISALAAEMDSGGIGMVIDAVGKILLAAHGIADQRGMDRASRKAARFLVDLSASLGNGMRARVMEDARSRLSAKTREEVIGILKASRCDFDSDQRDLLAFDLVEWKNGELEEVQDNTDSKSVKYLASHKIYEQAERELEGHRNLIEKKGRISAADFIDGVHESLDECLAELPHVDTTELMGVLWERKKMALVQALRDAPESREAGEAVSELVEYATFRPQLPYNALETVTLLAEAFAGAQDAGRRKIALAFADILAGTGDPLLLRQLEAGMSGAVNGCGGMLEGLLAETRNHERFEALLRISQAHVAKERLCALASARISELMTLFETTEGSESEKYLGRTVRLAAVGGSRELVFHAANRILEAARKAESTDARDAVAERAAWSLLHLVSGVPKEHLDDTLAFVSTWLRACSPTTRKEMLGIIKHGDGSDLSAFHLSDPRGAELEELKYADSEAVRSIAVKRLAMERKREEDGATEWKTQYLSWLMREDCESTEADRALASLVADATGPSAGREEMNVALGLMTYSLATASDRGKEKLALAAADLHLGIRDGRVKAEFAGCVVPILVENKQTVKRVIMNPRENEDRVRALFMLMKPHLTPKDGQEILIAVKKRKIIEVMDAFVSDPAAFGAEKFLERAVEIATTKDHEGKLELDVVGMFLDTIAKTKGTPAEGIAAKRLARAITDLVAGTEEELREEVVSLAYNWLPTHSMAVREEILGILRNSECEEGSAERGDLFAFDIIHPTIEELDGLVDGRMKARSEYVRRLAAERKELEGSIETDSEICQKKVAAFRESLAEFRERSGDPEGKKFLLGDILCVGTDARVNFSDYGKEAAVSPDGMQDWKHARMGPANGLIDSDKEKPKTKAPEKKRECTDLQKAAMMVEKALAELDTDSRKEVLAEMVLESLHAYESNPVGPGSRRHLESIAGAAASWDAAELSFVSDVIKRMLRSTEGLPNKEAKESAGQMMAEAMVMIAGEVKKDIRKEVFSEIRASVPALSGGIRQKMFMMLVDGKFDEGSRDRAKIIFELANPSGMELKHLIKNEQVSKEVRKLARVKKAEDMLGGRAPKPLDDDEKLIIEHALGVPNGFASVPEESLVDGFMNLDPGVRHAIMKGFVTSYFSGPDWKPKIRASEAAVASVSEKLGLEQPDAFEKRDALIARPDLLTPAQRRFVSELAGMNTVNGKIDPEMVRKAATRLAAIDELAMKPMVRRKLFGLNGFTRFASLLAMNRANPVTMNDLSKAAHSEDRDTLSRLVGKLEADMSDEDIADFAKRLAEKDRTAFDVLRTSEVDASMERFREAASEARQICDLLELLGRPMMPSKITENGQGIWSSKKSRGEMEDNGFSYILEANGLRRTRIDAVFDGMSGQAGASEASAVAREVFELGIMSGLLGTVEDAAILCEVADLAIANLNYDDATAGRIPDMAGGRGTTVALTLQAGDTLHAIHVGDSRWAVLRKGVVVKASEDHSLIQRCAQEALAALTFPDQDTKREGAKMLARLAGGKENFKALMEHFRGKNPSAQELSEYVIWHFEPRDINPDTITSGLGSMFGQLTIGRVELESGDTVALYTDGIGNVVCEHKLGRAFSVDDLDFAIQSVRYIAEDRSGTGGDGGNDTCGCRMRRKDDDKFMIAYRHAGDEAEQAHDKPHANI